MGMMWCMSCSQRESLMSTKYASMSVCSRDGYGYRLEDGDVGYGYDFSDTDDGGDMGCVYVYADHTLNISFSMCDEGDDSDDVCVCVWDGTNSPNNIHTNSGWCMENKRLATCTPDMDIYWTGDGDVYGDDVGVGDGVCFLSILNSPSSPSPSPSPIIINFFLKSLG